MQIRELHPQHRYEQRNLITKILVRDDNRMSSLSIKQVAVRKNMISIAVN